MTLPYAWHCLECVERGTGDGSDLAARKHEKATGHGTTTHLDTPKSGWCSGPIGAIPPHGECAVECGCRCHKAVAS